MSTIENPNTAFFPEEEKNKILPSTLYLVATPIGNLADISERAVKTLREVDFIAAEDTRNSGKLLRILGIEKPLVSYFEHNKAEKGPQIADRLEAGESCALITDAGTPAISDPGEDLVALCAQNGVDVISIPGPCALVTALSVSGLPTVRFVFEGFLPTNKKNRRQRLDRLAEEERTVILYEAPHKLRDTLEDLRATFGGERRISLCRELTKLHEQVLRTTLAEACDHYAENEPKGEFVLVVDGAPVFEEETVTPETALQRMDFLRQQGLSTKAAAKQAAEELGLPKNKLYDLALGKISQW